MIPANDRLHSPSTGCACYATDSLCGEMHLDQSHAIGPLEWGTTLQQALIAVGPPPNGRPNAHHFAMDENEVRCPGFVRGMVNEWAFASLVPHGAGDLKEN